MWFNQGRDGRPHAIVVGWNALKEQFKQQFNPAGNIREEHHQVQVPYQIFHLWKTQAMMG